MSVISSCLPFLLSSFSQAAASSLVLPASRSLLSGSSPRLTDLVSLTSDLRQKGETAASREQGRGTIPHRSPPPLAPSVDCRRRCCCRRRSLLFDSPLSLFSPPPHTPPPLHYSRYLPRLSAQAPRHGRWPEEVQEEAQVSRRKAPVVFSFPPSKRRSAAADRASSLSSAAGHRCVLFGSKRLSIETRAFTDDA